MAGLRILVVEDSFLVADSYVALLESHGCEVVGPASRVHEALELLQTRPVDGALLDVNLADEFSFPVAMALVQRRIPFILITGYRESILPAQFRSCPRLGKPFADDVLWDAILSEFGKTRWPS